jgi:hypothetical protein
METEVSYAFDLGTCQYFRIREDDPVGSVANDASHHARSDCSFAMHMRISREILSPIPPKMQAQALVGANIRQLWPDYAEGGEHETKVECYGVQCYGVYSGKIGRVWAWNKERKAEFGARVLLTIHYQDGDTEDVLLVQVQPCSFYATRSSQRRSKRASWTTRRSAPLHKGKRK